MGALVGAAIVLGVYTAPADKDLLKSTLFKEAGTDQLKAAEELGIKFSEE